jgi:carboxypeptidase family protein
MPGTIASFDGLSSQDNQNAYGFRVVPPDTNGEVGPNHYVQATNFMVRVYSKSGIALTAPFKLSALFASLGGICSTNNDGDPIVLYDQLADRWLLTQLAFDSLLFEPPFHQCIAISTSADPAGSYFAYDFIMPGDNFNDYPKFGVWPDAYYMSDNQFSNCCFNGAGAFAYNRARMLAGDPGANFIYFNLGYNFWGLLPSDLDGSTPPPANSPNSFAMLSSSTSLRVFGFHADFANPAASAFTEQPGSPIAIAAFDSFGNGIEQPGPATPLSYLDPLQDRLMHRLAYRNFGSRESLVVTHTVNVGPDPRTTEGHQSAIRYYELRRSSLGGGFTVPEQATFAPDGDNRWMGSVAMDSQGNIAVGYSVSSLTTYPSIRYAGRLASDPANGLYQGEATLISGSGVQLGYSRWGDYSALSVDPTDDCTFWYTTEYYTAESQASSDLGWLTRIGSFRFPTCGGGQAGTVTGHVRDANANAPISNALVTLSPGGSTSYTDANGLYTQTVAPGTYAVTASKPDYSNASASGLTVTNGGTTTQDLTLTFTSGALTGHVRNASSNAAIANALVTFSPGGLTTTSDASGLYAKILPPGTYAVTASGLDYLPQAVSGAVVTQQSATIRDFALTPVVYTSATYDSTLKTPKCMSGSACDSGSLLEGRDTIPGGAEPHQPNTIDDSCADGTYGFFHSDESMDRLKVSTLDGSFFSPGKTVRIVASVWFWGFGDQLDLFYTSNAANPSWTYLATLFPTGGTQSLQSLSATYVLPSGKLQAVRANFSYFGSGVACATGTDDYDDYDDLVFGVSAPFTDDPLIAGSTIVKGIHVTELRIRIDAARAARSLPAFSWTDATLSAGATLIKAVHITDLRTALAAVYIAAGETPPVYTDSILSPGVTSPKVAHIAEIRSALIAIE